MNRFTKLRNTNYMLLRSDIGHKMMKCMCQSDTYEFLDEFRDRIIEIYKNKITEK